MRIFKKLFGKAEPEPEPSPQNHEILNDTFRFVAIDVETANSDASSICQIGLALVTDTGAIHSVDLYIDPQCAFDGFNVNLHGINEETVSGKPTFDDTIQYLRAFLQRHPLIQHSNFDKQAIDKACKRYDLPPLRTNWHDSVVIARKAWPEFKGNGGHGLGNLKEVLNLDFKHHDAAEDAKAAAQVVLLAEKRTGQSFDELSARKTNGRTYPKSVAVEGNQNGPLFGHIVCFTGSLSISREQAATAAAGAGIAVKTTVTKKTTLLVVGDQDMTVLQGHKKSTKHRRAEELVEAGQEIRILGESEFLTLVKK